MKILQRGLATIISITAIVILLITAFEIGAYSDYGWYQKAYEKYDVLNDLEMEMKDVMYVTEEMMDYLRGNRRDLVVDTVVAEEEREFFNEREKAHMVDVRNLFVGGLWIRRIALVLFLLSVVVMIKTKVEWKRLLPKSFLIGLGAFAGVTTGVGLLVMSDFNKYFLMFHEMLFDNDLWLLDPRTDLLIRMLPEGFFLDMVMRIGIIILLLMFISTVISIVALYIFKDKNN
jgi:integral membrane protein (TIGR01906 family)